MSTLDCGRIINTHGLKGELKVDLWCDPDLVFSQVKDLRIGNQDYLLTGHRMHQRFALLTLEGVDTVEAARRLINRTITVDRDKIELGEGHYFFQDLYGFAVFDQRAGREIGLLKEVRELPSSLLYVIRAGEAEVLIPAQPPFAVGVELDKRLITVNTIEGMLPDEH